MGYFDDLTILSVRRVTTSVAKTPEASPFMGSLGVMEGKSVIRLDCVCQVLQIKKSDILVARSD